MPAVLTDVSRAAGPAKAPAPSIPSGKPKHAGSHDDNVPSFAILNAKVSWTVYRGLDLDLAASNPTDGNYGVAEGYPEAGRMVRLSLNYRF